MSELRWGICSLARVPVREDWCEKCPHRNSKNICLLIECPKPSMNQAVVVVKHIDEVLLKFKEERK